MPAGRGGGGEGERGREEGGRGISVFYPSSKCLLLAIIPKYQAKCSPSHTLSVMPDGDVCYSQVKDSVRGNKYVALKVAKNR